jgi:predicted kinase
MVTSSQQPLVVIISGPPASGKTTLAMRLASELGMPFVSRDAYKELLFDKLGWSDRAWSRKLGGASWELLYQVLDLLLTASAACVVEANFHEALSGDRLRRLQQRHAFRTVQVICQTDDATLLARFQARSTNGSRHPGHVDHLNRAELEERLRKRLDYSPGLVGQQILFDTTQFDEQRLATLLIALREALRPGSA